VLAALPIVKPAPVIRRRRLTLKQGTFVADYVRLKGNGVPPRRPTVRCPADALLTRCVFCRGTGVVEALP
jgi:hypothetical protein